MMDFLAQAKAPTDYSPFWSAPNGSTALLIALLAALVVGIGFILVLVGAPVRARRPIVAFFTFLAGGYYVLFYFWPGAIDRQPSDLPRTPMEGVGFWLGDA